jgi:hypothetical protein
MNQDFKKHAWMARYRTPKVKDIAGCNRIGTSVQDVMDQMKLKSTY